MFRVDFALRREMLLKRVDVTVQSFLWSDAAKGQELDIRNAISVLSLAQRAFPLFLSTTRLARLVFLSPCLAAYERGENHARS